jgi:sec-independent protein translocase protein TatA
MLTGLLVGRPSALEIGIIVLVIVLLFGASKIPKLARSMGQAKAEFQKGIEEGEQGLEDDDEDEPQTDAAGS